LFDAKDRIFPHAMLREIYQQPGAIEATLTAVTQDGEFAPGAWQAVHRVLQGHNRIVIAASGSSRHAGLAGEILIEDFSGVPVDVEYASEYCYRSTHTLHNPVVLVVSQSGETSDTLSAMREAKARGLETISITNVPGSTMVREASASLVTRADVETAVPATKSFTTQLTMLYLLAVYLGRMTGRMTAPVAKERLEQVSRVPALLGQWLPAWEEQVRAIVAHYAHAKAFLYLGRGIHYAIAREGALKLKEASYVHAEGYPTGELKHGPNALVGHGAPLVVLATCDRNDPDSVLRYSRTLQLLRDIQQQGGNVLALATEGDQEIGALCHHCIFVPRLSEYLLPICEAVPLQIFAYMIAAERGVDMDRPRNLTKAVLTE
jgi:glucosamine--fructose-6-phosphate aminotransferase (isomerizing)